MDSNCWFPKTDQVPGEPKVTAFKQRARLQQAQYREALGHSMGSHQRADGTTAKNGSKMAPEGGALSADFRNFLDSEAIKAAVCKRTNPANREPWQQIRPDRLRLDLLSSMPMCFNLFGELDNNPTRLTQAGRKLFGLEDSGIGVRFEHSPKRQSMNFTNDGTAFDVALFFGESHGPQMVIGVETKYHEHAIKELPPDSLTRKRPVIPQGKRKMPRYMQIAKRAEKEGIFKRGWEEKIFGSEIQQIWRDHLLLLSMLQYQDGTRWSTGTYVLVHPEENPSFAEAGKRYRDCLDDDRTFRVMTIEQLLKPGLLHGPPIAEAFKRRYLW
jgi:hypothetical protein